jgi:tRNA pseudouridine38-40 synthase
MRTVAGTLDLAVRQMDPQASMTRGVSRTDAGVHADGQRAAFDPGREIPLRGWVLGLNQHLPDDVVIRGAARCVRGFEPRFHNQGKRYRYRLRVDQLRHPQRDQRTWRLDRRLDIDAMREAATTLVGTHDFSAFHAARDQRTDFVRTVDSVEVLAHEDPEGSARPPLRDGNTRGQRVDVVVTGKAFLYNMVRIMVGTLVEIGHHKRTRDAARLALTSGRRADAGMTAPAHGLTLEEIFLAPGAEQWP